MAKTKENIDGKETSRDLVKSLDVSVNKKPSLTNTPKN